MGLIMATPALAQRGVQINVGPTGGDIIGDAANEVSLVIDPTSASRMAVGWRNFADRFTSLPAAGYAYSTNAGKTWTFPGTITHFPPIYDPPWISDPVLTVDADGLMHYVHLVWDEYWSYPDQAIYMSHSGDRGKTWVLPRIVRAISDGNTLDKPWVTTDRTYSTGRHNLYVTYSFFDENGNPDALYCQRSRDRGFSFEDPVLITGQATNAPMPVVDPLGDLYVVYIRFSDDMILIKKSTNAKSQGAMTFNVFPGNGWIEIGQGTDKGGHNPPVGLHTPAIAVDAGLGPHSGNLYVVWVGKFDGSDTDIFFARSTNGGYDWTGPTVLNSDYLQTDNDQFLPAIDVAKNGRIDVAWYDRRADPDNEDCEIYYAFSKDGGQTWKPNKRLTESFDPNLGFPVMSQKIGEYVSVGSTLDRTHVVYCGTYEGEQNIYCRTVIHNFPIKPPPKPFRPDIWQVPP
ncbi:MAG: sialidase family protein [Planctomycetota bacterium]|jgi:hypothetical protein